MMGSDNSQHVEVKTTAQNLTTSWADLGSEIDTAGFQTMLIWVQVDINNGANVRIKPLAKRASAAAVEYDYPIYTAGSTDVGVEDLYYEWTTDADQNTVLEVNLKGYIPVVQLRVQAGTAGAPTAAQIDSCYVHLI